MKKRNQVITINNRVTQETVQSPVLTRDYLDTLEESLYIWWELRPASRMWKADLVRTGVTTFYYVTEEEPALVRWTGDLAYTVEW